MSDDSGIIKNIRFVNSPDTKNNRIKYFQLEKQIMEYIDRYKNEFPEDINFQFREDRKKYFLSSNSQEFARVSIIDLTVPELGSFVKHLANYLDQPIQKNWDLITIKELLAS